MKSILRKITLTFMICLSLQFGTPQRAQAVFAAPAAAPNLVLLLAAGGFGVLFGGAGIIGFANSEGKTANILSSVLLILVGVAFLPQDSNNMSYEFSVLKAEDAFVKTLSARKVAIYNREIPQINLIAQEINSKILEGQIRTYGEAHGTWSSYQSQGLISKEAYEVLQAVSDQNARVLSSRL